MPGASQHNAAPGKSARQALSADRSPARPPLISIILPVLNEAGLLAATLASLPASPEVEIILVDGGSRDGTWEAAGRFAQVRRLQTAAGRGRQMNAGALAARGDLLVFLHADTRLAPAHLATLRGLAADGGFEAGAFELLLDPPAPALRFIAWGANLRSRFLRLPYGDQVLILRRRLFLALGGFSHRHPEDLDLVLRLRKNSHLRLLQPPVASSARRWQVQGYFRTTMRNWFLLARHLAERLCTRRWPALGEARSSMGKWDF